jgi:hypothetical protein
MRDLYPLLLGKCSLVHRDKRTAGKQRYLREIYYRETALCEMPEQFAQSKEPITLARYECSYSKCGWLSSLDLNASSE